MDQNYLRSLPSINPARGFYELNYDLSAFFLLNDTKRIHVGLERKRTCRFCLGQEGINATFKKDAHGIPEMLGNKTLFTGNECDACNLFFGSGIEHQLGAYLKPYRAMAAIMGKKGFPRIENSSEGWSVRSSAAGISIEHNGLTEMFDFDRENKKAVITLKRDPYVPRNIFKALVKMAVSLAPDEEADHFADAARWVRYGDAIDVRSCYASLTFVEGWRPLKCMMTGIFKRKHPSRELPAFMFVLSFANLSFQIAVPCLHLDQHIIGRTVKFPPFPTPYEYGFENWPIGHRTLDLSGTEKIEFEEEKFSFGFDAVELIRGDGQV